MDSSVSPKDEIWFLRVCHHISNAVYWVSYRSQSGRGVAVTGHQPRSCTFACLQCRRSHFVRRPTNLPVRYELLCCLSPGLVERPSGECVSEPQCPHPCRCSDGIVDCQEKALTKVPDHLPEATTELWVECLQKVHGPHYLLHAGVGDEQAKLVRREALQKRHEVSYYTRFKNVHSDWSY